MFDSREGQESSVFCKASMLVVRPIQWVSGVYFPLGKAAEGRSYSPQSCGEVKNEWSYASTPLCVFMLWFRDFAYK